MLGATEVVSHGFKLLECDVDRAVLTARKKKRALPIFKISLDGCPARGANAKAGARNVGRDFAFLQRVKLLQLFQAECKNIVVQRLRRAAQQTIERALVACSVSRVNAHDSTHVAARLPLQAYRSVPNHEVQMTAVRSAL